MGVRYINLFYRTDGAVFLNGIKESDRFVLKNTAVGKANELEVIGHYKYLWKNSRITNPKKLAFIKPEYIVTVTYRNWPKFWEKTTEQVVPAYQYFELINPLDKAYIASNWHIEDFLPIEEEDNDD